jgi:DNA-binding beta-propeller fold protein YncE
MQYQRRRLADFMLIVLMAVPINAPAAPPLQKLREIAMPGVEGRIDHMAADPVGHRLFVAALGNNTLEVLDTAHGKWIGSIAGLREPQGVAFLPRLGRIAVANGDDGSCRFFDSRTYEPVASIDCRSDADNLRYDAHADCLFVGYGKGAVTEIDVAKMRKSADIPLPGHPESFQLETSGTRVFVNIPSRGQIAVIDRRNSTVAAHWPIADSASNFPMALDEAHHRLLVGCRRPARLVVFDTVSGKTVAALPCTRDTDDLFYDARQRRVYVSGGEGAVSVFQQADADHYSLLATVPTAAGARTSLFVPEAERLYVAVPHRGKQRAAIWEYATSPR